MSSKLTLEQVYGCEDPTADVIFVHGLTGDPLATWNSPPNRFFWPRSLGEDLKSVAVYTLGYPAPVFAGWARNKMDLFERASNVLEHFAGFGIGQNPLVFVTHSLGGILVKMILRKSFETTDNDWHRVVDATRLVVFLSTPHTGSALSQVFSLLPRSSSYVDLVANKTGFLSDLNEYYRTLANNQTKLRTAAYYEVYPTNGIIVVPRDSADPGVGVTPVPLDRDHRNICKPESVDDIVYLGVKRHIKNALGSFERSESDTNGHRLASDYVKRSARDRRDLFEKLTDAGREHEYGYANDAQNGFARQYTRTGLLTAARDDHEYLLSEIETRFITHVYHPLICRSAEDGDVRRAIQEQIIDPLAGRKIGGTIFSSVQVLNGLYYLTEQCHIKWDIAK